jgi:hypothetical protein
MRRARANRQPPRRPAGAIGITLTPGAPSERPGNEIAAAAPAGGCVVSGPYYARLLDPGGTCGYLIWMLGITDSDDIEWVIEWEDMDADEAGQVNFGVDPTDYPDAIFAAQTLAIDSGSLAWIDLTANVNGQQFGPVRIESACEI